MNTSKVVFLQSTILLIFLYSRMNIYKQAPEFKLKVNILTVVIYLARIF